MWAQINEWFGIIVKEGKGLEQKPLNSFLAKSLNLELINVILQGVTKFAEPDYNKIRKDEDDEQYGRNYFRQKGFQMRKLKLDRIKILDPQKWDAAGADNYSTSEVGGLPSPSPLDRLGERKKRKVLKIYENVKVYDFAHRGFHKLRDMDGITP